MPDKCLCGCGNEVTWNVQKGRWNKYIWHHSIGCYNKTKEHSENITRLNKMRILSTETKNKISKSLQGHIRSEESRLKQSITIIDKELCLSSNNNSWKGGISPYTNTGEWIKLSAEIKKRDNFTCQECGCTKTLTVHHIDFTKSNHSPLNLITLCKQCHANIHTDNGDYKRQRRNNGIQKP